MKLARVLGWPVLQSVGTESPSTWKRSIGPPPKVVTEISTSLSDLYIFDSTFSWFAPLSARGVPDGALYPASCHTSRFELRSVTVCRAQASPGKPVGPSGVSRLAVVLNVHLFAAQSAVTCISIWVAGSTGIEVVAVLDAAEANAGCASTAVSNVATLAAVIRFIVRKVSGSLFVVGDFDRIRSRPGLATQDQPLVEILLLENVVDLH